MTTDNNRKIVTVAASAILERSLKNIWVGPTFQFVLQKRKEISPTKSNIL